MKINSITLKLGGLKGLLVSYQVIAESFIKDHKVSYRKPVQGLLKEKFLLLTDIVREVCQIKEDATVRINSIENIDSKEQAFSLQFTVCCDHIERMYDAATPIMSEVDGIPGFDEAFEVVTAIMELTEKHLESKQKVDTRQLLMEFKESMPKKFSGDIDAMSKKEQIEKAKEILGSIGAIIIDPEDTVEEVEAGDEKVKDVVENTTETEAETEWPGDSIAEENPFAEEAPVEKADLPKQKNKKLKVA